MQITRLTDRISVSPQIAPGDVAELAALGFRAIICNRPDDEEPGQVSEATICEEVTRHGMAFAYVPAVSGAITAADGEAMANALATLPAPVLAYCRSGARSTKLHEMAQGAAQPAPAPSVATRTHDVVIVGGGSAGIATAASLLKRNARLDIAIIEPSEVHYYQPGWTMVGGGIFDAPFTRRSQASVMPDGVKWIRASASGFAPEDNRVILCDGSDVHYRVLVACPGIKLDWDAIPGLRETLGTNGVTSNYGYDLAPYTRQLVDGLKGGRALFTQPPMPIKCAGAPQKAMYLSCTRWEKSGVLPSIDVQFHTAGAVLFGVPAYVPALMEYVDRYGAHLNFESKLVAIDGPGGLATFEQKRGDTVTRVEERFDMIHVVPPQTAPDFIRSSPLAAASGFIDVDEATLRHSKYANVFALGDACSASNAKTMAAARKQAPVVAVNVLAALEGKPPVADYDGYGSCPLTVESGKIVLAEFGYGGKLLPSFPTWLIDGTRPSRLAWLLKDTILPPVYWHGMLKGREWMVKPHTIGS
ncbi:TIGR01244 family sulfur transferase [Blastomonas sp.]|uniref:TIGR01244 family sulfur transferase n=1 Tax=Blastomonas sp. TaxID=1909299 RepID=UPI00391B8161